MYKPRGSDETQIFQKLLEGQLGGGVVTEGAKHVLQHGVTGFLSHHGFPES